MVRSKSRFYGTCVRRDEKTSYYLFQNTVLLQVQFDIPIGVYIRLFGHLLVLVEKAVHFIYDSRKSISVRGSLRHRLQAAPAYSFIGEIHLKGSSKLTLDLIDERRPRKQ